MTNSEETARPAPKWLNPACEYGPLGVFFVAYLVSDLFVATAAVMIATVVALAISYAMVRKLPKLPLVTAPILLVMGGLTLYLEDATFIKIRPTIVNSLLGLVLLASYVLKKQPLKFMMGQALDLTDNGWRVLTLRFGFFFFFLAAMNELVWRTQSEDFWVTYKVFGTMGMTFAFVMTQTPFINRNMRKNDDDADEQAPDEAS